MVRRNTLASFFSCPPIIGLEDSISGSASSSEDDDSEDSDAVDVLVKTRRQARSSSPSSSLHLVPQTALAWFHSPPSTQIGIYRALFSHPKDASSHLLDLRTMQSSVQDGRTWAMFMVAGGHFAGAVVRVSATNQDGEVDDVKTKKKPKRPKPDTELLRHKTFHRYTSPCTLLLDYI
jgi:Bacteroidetes VLRF1 release factor